MTLDGNEGWYWRLKSLPDRVREVHDAHVRFSIVEHEIGSRLCVREMAISESAIAYDIMDADTLLGILFDESLKSKCIAEVDENWCPMSVIDITIVLVQGARGYTNIDADVMESFAKVFQK